MNLKAVANGAPVRRSMPASLQPPHRRRIDELVISDAVLKNRTVVGDGQRNSRYLAPTDFSAETRNHRPDDLVKLHDQLRYCLRGIVLSF
jgi:hypothetical protein